MSPLLLAPVIALLAAASPDVLLQEAETIRTKICACSDHRCFVDAQKSLWDPFERRANASFASFTPQQKARMARMAAIAEDALSRCEAKLVTFQVPSTTIVNECSITYGSNTTIMALALIETAWSDANGTSHSDKTIYRLGCQRQKTWTCNGTQLRLDHNLTYLSLGDVALELISVSGPTAILRHGVHTFTIDVRNGVIELRDDASAYGKARCLATYVSPEDAAKFRKAPSVQ